MKDEDEPLVAKLRAITSHRNPADFSEALRSITRRDITDILTHLDPPDPQNDMFRDSKGDKIGLDDWVEYTDLEFNEHAGRFAKVVGLSDQHDNNVVILRFGHETRVRKIHPARVTITTTSAA